MKSSNLHIVFKRTILSTKSKKMERRLSPLEELKQRQEGETKTIDRQEFAEELGSYIKTMTDEEFYKFLERNPELMKRIKPDISFFPINQLLGGI